MLKKAHRLSTREFALVVERGREAYSPFFSLRFVPADSFKLSSTAPKKVWKTAVARNRFRRRIYAAVADVVYAEKPKPVFAALIGKRSIDDIEPAVLVRMLAELFVKAGLTR